MLMNNENEWSDNIDASKVEGAVRRSEVEEVRYELYVNPERKWSLWGCCRVV